MLSSTKSLNSRSDLNNMYRSCVWLKPSGQYELHSKSYCSETRCGATVAGAAGTTTGLARGASKRGYDLKSLDFTKNNLNIGPSSPATTW